MTQGNVPEEVERQIINTMVKQEITPLDDGWSTKGNNFESVCKRYADDPDTWAFIDGDRSIAFSFDTLRWDTGEVIKSAAGHNAGKLEESDAGVSITYGIGDGLSIEILQDHYSWQKVVHIDSLGSLGKIPADARWLEVVFSIEESVGLDDGAIDTTAKISKNSQLQPIKAWDQKDNCDLAFGEIRDGKLIKRIPVEWLLAANYPVHTDATIAFGYETTFNSATTSYTSVAALDSTHFVVVYSDIGNSNYGTARVGEISNTMILSYGAEKVFNSGTTYSTGVAALDSTHFVVIYRDYDNSNCGTAVVGVVSGTTISSYGAENVFNSASTYDLVVAALDTTRFVVAYRDSGNSQYGTAIVGVVSGTTISSYGSENVFNAATTLYTSVAALDSTHFVVTYQDYGNSRYGTAIVGVVSGTTISSYGSENVFNTAETLYISVDALDSTHFVVVYRDVGNHSHGTGRIGLVSGTTISSYGSENVFNASTTSYMSVSALDSTNFIAMYRDVGNSYYGTAIVGVVSGTTISSYGSENVFNEGESYYVSGSALDSTHFVVAYTDVGNYDQGTAIIGSTADSTPINTTLPVGILLITDLDGNLYQFLDDIQDLETSTAMSDSTDTFSFSLDNSGDTYSYVKKGCAIEIKTGIGSPTTKIVGFITDAPRTLRGDIQPIVSVSGEDGSIRLNDIFFSGRFYDHEISALFKAIIDATDLTTGVTYRALADCSTDNTHIESTIYSIDEATYNWQSLGSALKDLASLVGYGWFRDTARALHFFDPTAAALAATIVDADLEGAPTISNVGEIVNRAVVIGGYEQITDKSGSTQTGTTTITDSSAKNQSFVPTEEYLSSVLVYTELVTDSASDITISIQADSSSAPDGIYLSHGPHVVKMVNIVDSGYTEFRFESHVTLTPGDTYWIVLHGTTSDGVDVGVAAGVLDCETRYPERVAVMTNDDASQALYANADGSPGIYMKVFRDEQIEDSQIAEVRANEMLVPTAKKVASLTIRDDTLKAGDVVQLTLSTVGVAINKKMKIRNSTQKLGDIFIYNALDMEEI